MNFRKLPIVIALASASSLAFGLDQKGLSGNGQTGVFLNLDTQYDVNDNIFLESTNETDDDILIVAPTVRLVGKSGLNTYEASYSGSYGQYSDSDDDDYDDHTFSAFADFDINDSSQLMIDASIERLHDARGTGGSEGGAIGAGSEPDEYDLDTLGFEFEIGADSSKFQAQVRAEQFNKEYTNNSATTFDRDYDQGSVGGTLLFNVSPDFSLLLEVASREIEYDQAPNSGVSLDSDEQTVFVGIEWGLTAKTTGYVKIGREEKEFDDTRRRDQDDVSWDVSVSWAPREYSTITFGTSKGFNETNGFGDAILSRSVDVSWNHQWSDRFVTNVAYSMINDEFDPSVREDDTDRFTFNAQYELRKWVDLEFNAVFADRDSNAARIDYTQDVFSFGVNFGI